MLRQRSKIARPSSLTLPHKGGGNAPCVVRGIVLNMSRGSSLIDHHAPGNAADRNRDRRLAGLRVDDGDVVTEAVGDEELALVLGERDAPRALADQDIG